MTRGNTLACNIWNLTAHIMLDAFCEFTTEHHLSVNVEKTKCMLVNCQGSVSCYGEAVANVKEFRYLGIPMLSTARSPEHILQNRLKAAQRAFAALCANAHYFGILNCRVRVQLIQSLVISHLMFGCVIWACLSDISFSITGHTGLWLTVERQLRAMLRWALYLPRDTRCSLMHVLGHCPTLQALVFKRCLRYF